MRFDDQKILRDCYERKKQQRGGKVVILKPDMKRMKTDKLYRPPPTSAYNHVFSSRLNIGSIKEPITQARMQKQFGLLLEAEQIDVADIPMPPSSMFNQGLLVMEDAIQKLQKFDALRALQQEPRSVFFKGEEEEEKDEDEEKETVEDFVDDVMMVDIDATTAQGLGAEEQDLSGFPRQASDVLREGAIETSKTQTKKKLRGDAIKKGKEEAKRKKQAMEAKQAEERGEGILKFTQRGAEKTTNQLRNEIAQLQFQIEEEIAARVQNMPRLNKLEAKQSKLRSELQDRA
jgi:chemotaxis protein histidine kinase CheA